MDRSPTDFPDMGMIRKGRLLPTDELCRGQQHRQRKPRHASLLGFVQRGISEDGDMKPGFFNPHFWGRLASAAVPSG